MKEQISEKKIKNTINNIVSSTIYVKIPISMLLRFEGDIEVPPMNTNTSPKASLQTSLES